MKSIRLISAGKASWDHFLSLERPLVIGSTSYHREYLLSSERPLVIGSTSYHWEYLSSSKRPLLIGSSSYHREYLLPLERPLLVVPLVVDSHFCQTESAIVCLPITSQSYINSYFEILARSSCFFKSLVSIKPITTTTTTNFELKQSC